MTDALLVGLKIIAMFLVIAVGYACRRRGTLNAETTPVLSRLVTDIMLPALIFIQMADKVDLPSLRAGWIVPLLACAGTCVGFVLGWATWRLFATRAQAPVFIFASGISNWVYLPLPIVMELYGASGLQTLFLCNLGLQVLFWTLGVAILHGGRLDTRAFKRLATNPGLIATVAGIAFAVSRGMFPDAFAYLAAHHPWIGAASVLEGGMRLLGDATIPVSLIVTGAQIAAATLVQNTPRRAIAGVILNRLLLAPLLCLLLLAGFAAWVPMLRLDQLMVIAIVVSMPVSVTSTVLTEKMNQDTALAAQSVLYSTLASIAVVPPMVYLAKCLLGGL